MKAAVLREVKTPLVIEDVTLDEPGPGQVLVKTAATGANEGDECVNGSGDVVVCAP